MTKGTRSEEEIKAKAREEAKQIIPEMKVAFADTEEGITFRAAYDYVTENYGKHGEIWTALIMYQYGIERGQKAIEKAANPVG